MAALVSDCDSQSLRRNKNIDSFLQRCECLLHLLVAECQSLFVSLCRVTLMIGGPRKGLEG